MGVWFYADGGKRAGPVSEERLQELLERNLINESTLVWKEGGGSDWKSFSDWPELRSSSAPPPLPGSGVTDTWVWLMAAVPLVAAFVEVIISESRGEPVPGSSYLVLYFLPYLVLAMMDDKAIKNSGRKEQTGGIFWFIIIVPAYLFMRSRRLRKSQAVLAAWIASFIASMFVIEGLASSTGIYLGAGVPPCSSQASRAQIRQLFPQMYNNAAQARVVDISNISESSSTDERRVCTAVVEAASTDRVSVRYTIDSRGDDFYYEISTR